MIAEATTIQEPDLFSWTSSPVAPENEFKVLPSKVVQFPKAVVAPHIEIKGSPISKEAISILLDVNGIEKNGEFQIHLTCGAIDNRGLYDEVNEVLVALGGRWKGNKKCHVFSYDAKDVITRCAEIGRKPEKNPLDYFPTPKSAIKAILENSYLNWIAFGKMDGECPFYILEPSAGTGNIAAVLTEEYPAFRDKVIAVEMNPINAAILRNINGVAEVHQNDFLTWQPSPEAHPRVAFMNPPFSYQGNKTAYIDHINHAWDIVTNNPEGKLAGLIAIIPASWIINETAKATAFRNMVGLHGRFEDLDSGTFKESGTGIDTCAIHLEFHPDENLSDTEDNLIHHFEILIQNTQESTVEAAGMMPPEDHEINEEWIATCDEFYQRWAKYFLKTTRVIFPTTPRLLALNRANRATC